MVISYREIRLQFILYLIVIVQAEHLWSRQSVAATAATTTSEASVASIVHVAEHHYSAIILHVRTHHALSIPMLCTNRQVDVSQVALVHALLDTKVQHGLLLAVINTGHPCKVTLLVISLHLFYNRCRQVLQSRLRVASHEFLAVNHYLLYLLAIDGNLSTIINLRTRQTFHQFFYYRALRCPVCSSIIYEGILLHYHLCSNTVGNDFLQQYRIRLHVHPSEGKIIIVADGDVSQDCLVANDTHFEDILAIFRCLYRKMSVHVADGSCHVSRVSSLQQLYRHLHDALL